MTCRRPAGAWTVPRPTGPGACRRTGCARSAPARTIVPTGPRVDHGVGLGATGQARGDGRRPGPADCCLWALVRWGPWRRGPSSRRAGNLLVSVVGDPPPPGRLGGLLDAGVDGEPPLSLIHRPPPGGPPELIAEGLEPVVPAGPRRGTGPARPAGQGAGGAHGAADARAEPATVGRPEGPAGGGGHHPDPRAGARPAARPGDGTLLGAPPAALWRPGHHRTAGMGRPGDRQPRPGGRGRGGAPGGLAGLGHDPAPGRTRPAGGGPGLPPRGPDKALS